jgi:hypothetical protein
LRLITGERTLPQGGIALRHAPIVCARTCAVAVDAYLHALDIPASQRFEQSLERWFADTERFARQLREVKHDDYIVMKRGQYLRQQAVIRKRG